MTRETLGRNLIACENLEILRQSERHYKLSSKASRSTKINVYLAWGWQYHVAKRMGEEVITRGGRAVRGRILREYKFSERETLKNILASREYASLHISEKRQWRELQVTCSSCNVREELLFLMKKNHSSYRIYQCDDDMPWGSARRRNHRAQKHQTLVFAEKYRNGADNSCGQLYRKRKNERKSHHDTHETRAT